LIDRLDRDRSNVNRSLNRLRGTGFVARGRRIIDEGGHVYQCYALVEASETVVARAIDCRRPAALNAVGSEQLGPPTKRPRRTVAIRR
jgi:DNA-binding MarR family transcriptional regulator